MQGIFLSYDKPTDTCLISGDDGNRYTCGKNDWLLQYGEPKINCKCDFEVKDGRAINVVAVKDASFSKAPTPDNSKKGGCLKSALLVVGGLFALFIVLAIIGSLSGDDTPASTNSSGVSAPATPIEPVREKWSYSSDKDEMNSKTIRHAILDSDNELHLSSPYHGAQKGTLHIRKHPRFGNDVIVQIERGQILCQSYEDCTIMIRFDDKPASAFSAIGPSDNSTEYVFIRNYNRFYTQMKASKKVVIELPIYQEGNQTLTFDIADFDEKQFVPTE